ncbi:hypothetical protein ACLKMH_15805 [Psychromonas sp. KJ10-10]|uniref:hypothetical protein n=1 Tax=Psychromonas sp. KJ10-10 TaxID=3391823 RepID=UPI0039B5E0D0
MKLLRILLASLIIIPCMAKASVHFGAGIGFYDEQYLHYNDKGYYENFSVDLGVYSDFDNSHLAFLDIHLYSELTKLREDIKPITYAGIGAIFIKDVDNYSHDMSTSQSEENWGLRFPIGIEFMTSANISIFAEIIPTYIVLPNEVYETTTSFGIRYYFY